MECCVEERVGLEDLRGHGCFGYIGGRGVAPESYWIYGVERVVEMREVAGSELSAFDGNDERNWQDLVRFCYLTFLKIVVLPSHASSILQGLNKKVDLRS